MSVRCDEARAARAPLAGPAAAAGLALTLLASCAQSPGAPSGAALSLTVAALDLPGITNARYSLRVENGSDETVVDVELTADVYGDGAGGLSYVAPCDADDNDNTVTLELLALYEGAAGTTPIDVSRYQNPGPVDQTVTCLADADVAVDFDISILRQANQGFFDIAVELDQVFCSAKLDCEKSPGVPLELLTDDDGTRGPTAVLGFACTADISGGGETVQYLDDVGVSCGGGANSVTLDPAAGPGQLDLADADQATVVGTNPLFAAAVYRGTEQLGFDKQYWNVALGLDGLADCALTTTGLATRGALDDGTTPANAVVPYLSWSVTLTDGSGAVACRQHPVNTSSCPSSGVCTVYTDFASPVAFGAYFDGSVADAVAPDYAATGGLVTDIPGYRVHTFTSDGTFTVTGDAMDVEVLVVAGGGGGGGRSGGGGGAGGLLYDGAYALTAGQVVTVVVGAGGSGGDGSGGVGGYGGNSTFGTLVAIGGGGGGSDSSGGDGRDGGSGGGARYAGSTGGDGTAGQGHGGGTGTNNPYNGGGGGGAGGPGVSGTTSDIGDGGPGLAYDITGTSTYYAGGGGGGSHNPCGGHGYGGIGGGGDGGVCSSRTNGQAGTPNTGGGGGAGTTISGNGGAGGAGGSGVVIVRYPQ